MSELEEQSQAHRGMIGELEAKVAELKGKLAQSKTKGGALEGELNETKIRFQQEQETTAGLEQELLQLKRDLGAKAKDQEEQELLSHKQVSPTQDTQSLEAELEESQLALAGAQSAIELLEKQLEEAAGLRKALRDCQDELHQQAELLKRAQRKGADDSDLSTSLALDLAQACTTPVGVAGAQARSNTAMGTGPKADELGLKNEHLQDRIRELEKAQADLQSLLEAEQRKTRDASNRLQPKDTKALEFNAERLRFEEEIARLTRELEEYEDLIVSFKRQETQLIGERQAFERQVFENKVEADRQKRFAHEAHAGRVKAIELNLDQQNKIRQLQDELAALRFDFANLTKRKLDESTNRCQELEEQIEALTASQARINKALSFKRSHDLI